MATTFYVLPFGNPTSGTFTLGFTGTTVTTAALPYNCSASAMQSALSAIVAGVTVTGGGGAPWVVSVPSGYVLVVASESLPGTCSLNVTSTDSVTWSGDIYMTGTTDYETTGVATAVFTPSGGASSLPALVDGPPGLPPQLTVNATQVAAGQPPTVSTQQTAPGGPGQQSAYTINLGIPVGQTGPTGPTATVETASDVEGTPADGSTLIWSGTDSKFKIQPIWLPALYSCQSFTAFASGARSSATVASIGIPAQAFAWRPDVAAQIQVSGTVNTHIDLAVMLGDPTNGQQVGYGIGVTGLATQTVQAMRAFGSPIAGTSTFGEVAAGATATLFLVALQTASTTDAWSVSTSHASFEVSVVPIP